MGVSSGGRAMKIEEARAGESSSRRTWARASATVASGRQDDRDRGHQAAGGVLVVLEQAADVLGAFGFHQLEQFLRLGAGEFGEEVGGVVRVHFFQHVGGAFDVEGGEDLHLVVLGHLLQDVGQALVLEFAGDLEAALVAHLLQGFGEVGGLQVLVGGDELGGGLRLGLGALLRVGPVDDQVSLRRSRLSGEREWPRRTKSLLTNQSPERCWSIAMSSMVASPLPSARVTRRSNISATTRVSAPRCSKRRRLTRPGADDLGLVDGGDAGHRDEDALLAGDLDDDADHVRGAAGAAGEHDDVAQPAQTVAQGVEDIQSEEARNKDPR